jgi:hypothetical protein
MLLLESRQLEWLPAFCLQRKSVAADAFGSEVAQLSLAVALAIGPIAYENKHDD